jgi:4-hydroxy-tetrahydrodipicolinate synthase
MTMWGKAAAVEAARNRIATMRDIANGIVRIPAIKAMIARRCGDDTWLNVRPPLLALTAAQWGELDSALRALD